MLETKKGKRIRQVLAAAMSHEELAEVLWCTEDKLRTWKECANELRKVNAELKAENGKLRDAMYTNAGKHALQHMDEDELRIWATQQSEYIEELKELARDMWRFTGTACKKYPRLFDPSAQGGQTVQLNQIDSFEQRMRKLGVEANV